MCRYYEVCPSKTGYCVGHDASEECVKFILTQYEHLKIRFIDLTNLKRKEG